MGSYYAAEIDGTEKVVLKSGRELLPGNSNPMVSGSRMTIRIDRIVIVENYEDWTKGKNEILVMSEHYFGDKCPEIQAIHFAQSGIGARDLPYNITNLQAPTVFLTEDYDGESRMFLRFRAIEVDVLSDATINAIGAGIATAGTLFPQLVPFAPLFKPVSESILKMIDEWDKNDEIFGQRHSIELFPQINEGFNLLQKGRFVMFRELDDRSGYKIDPDHVVYDRNDQPFSGCSYIVFSIHDRHLPTPDYNVTDAKICKLMTQILKPRDYNTFDFLNETMKYYQVGKSLERRKYILSISGDKRTDELRNVLDKIENDPNVKPYL